MIFTNERLLKVLAVRQGTQTAPPLLRYYARPGDKVAYPLVQGICLGDDITDEPEKTEEIDRVEHVTQKSLAHCDCSTVQGNDAEVTSPFSERSSKNNLGKRKP